MYQCTINRKKHICFRWKPSVRQIKGREKKQPLPPVFPPSPFLLLLYFSPLFLLITYFPWTSLQYYLPPLNSSPLLLLPPSLSFFLIPTISPLSRFPFFLFLIFIPCISFSLSPSGSPSAVLSFFPPPVNRSWLGAKESREQLPCGSMHLNDLRSDPFRTCRTLCDWASKHEGTHYT